MPSIIDATSQAVSLITGSGETPGIVVSFTIEDVDTVVLGVNTTEVEGTDYVLAAVCFRSDAISSTHVATLGAEVKAALVRVAP